MSNEGGRPRLPTWARIALGVAALVALVVLVRLLPIEAALEEVTGFVESLGMWGPVVFGVIYVLAALLFVPGAAITLAAGAIFGLLGGTVIVSLASTTAAALAYLVARHLARAAVERKAKESERFRAIDQAIRQGGWKVVALLRLSPAVPFSVGNYLYGLTAIGFVSYVLASWVAMLPGTVLYVYLGHAGRAGLEAAEGGGGRTTAEWIFLGVGLLATVVVSVYVTRLARKALREGRAGTEALKDVVDEDREDGA